MDSKDIRNRPLNAGDSSMSNTNDNRSKTLIELTKKHRPDLVDYLPEFLRKFDALSDPAENPNQESIDLSENDIDILQMLVVFYRKDSAPIHPEILHQTVWTVSIQNLVSDILVSTLIIMHIMEIIGWPFNK